MAAARWDGAVTKGRRSISHDEGTTGRHHNRASINPSSELPALIINARPKIEDLVFTQAIRSDADRERVFGSDCNGVRGIYTFSLRGRQLGVTLLDGTQNDPRPAGERDTSAAMAPATPAFRSDPYRNKGLHQGLSVSPIDRREMHLTAGPAGAPCL